MKEPLVSVKMITYNHAPYIAQAIEGVLMQKTNFSFELVIGEDCSTDGTREIVFDYAKRHPEIIRVIFSNKNLGAKENNSRARSACRGKYIALCEGDDFWQRTDKLQLQVDYFEEHPECGLVYSDLDWYLEKTNRTIQNYLKYSEKETSTSVDIKDILLKKSDIRTCTVLLRRELFEQVLHEDPHLHTSGYFKMGDTQLWAEMSLKTELHCINESLATYRISEESATQSKNKVKSLRFWISDYEMHIYLCDKHDLPIYIKNIYMNKWKRSSLQLACYLNDTELANNVRKRAPHFNIKDWIWYWGSKNILAKYFIITAKKSYNSIR